MHETVGVGGVQGARELGHDVDGAFGRERSLPCHDGAEVVTDHEAHVEVQAAVDGAEVVDRDDVRLVEPRDQCRLPAEPRSEHRVVGEIRDEALEGDDAVTHRVLGAEHLTHPATAEQLEQLVGPEGLHDREPTGS